MQKEEATVLSGCQDRPKVGRWWRTTAIVAMAGGLALSGCTTNTDTSGPATSTTAAAAKKVDEIAATVPEDIKKSGKLIVGVNVPYTPNEFKDPSGKIVGFDVDLMNAIATTLGLTAEYREADFAKIIPAIQGRHLQRRHVVVHRHQGARAVGRLRHLLLGGYRMGQAEGLRHHPDNACGRRWRPRPPPPRKSTNCRAAARRASTPVSRRSTSLKFDGQDQATNAVVLGQADAMSADSPVTLYAIKQSNGKLEQAGQTFDSAPYGWPVKKGSPWRRRCRRRSSI